MDDLDVFIPNLRRSTTVGLSETDESTKDRLERRRASLFPPSKRKPWVATVELMAKMSAPDKMMMMRRQAFRDFPQPMIAEPEDFGNIEVQTTHEVLANGTRMTRTATKKIEHKQQRTTVISSMASSNSTDSTLSSSHTLVDHTGLASPLSSMLLMRSPRGSVAASTPVGTSSELVTIGANNNGLGLGLGNGHGGGDLGADRELDLAIEATLQKTMDTFQDMVQKQRAEFLKYFPQLQNARAEASMGEPGTEIVTETRVRPDGTVVEVQTTRTRRVLHVSKCMSIVNGVVRNSSARAVMEYQGPGGGYRLKLEDGSATPDTDSETEEDDDSDRASIAPSEFSDVESVVAVRRPTITAGPQHSEVPKLQASPKRKQEKAWYAAQELVESERRYLDKLRLLDQMFRARVQEDAELAKSIGNDKLAKLFSNLGTLYSFHNEHLLPQLENRLREWHDTHKICDVMRRQAPFLKIYSEYTSNYKKATKTFEDLRRKNKRFAAIIDEIEKLPECDHLPLSNHIICPVQRVTRYHLLMTEYLKNLSDGHPDKEDTTEALELTKKAAAHANEMLRQLDKYKHVMEVQELLGSQIHELITPSRELVKKGSLTKISARSGEHQPRYVFLFNDMLLLCSERRNVVASAWGGGKYKLRAIFEADGMQVLEGDNLDVENSFYVRSGNKTVELYTNTAKDKGEWMEVLWSVIQDFTKRMQSFKRPDDPPACTSTNTPETTNNGGKRCTICSSVFNAFKKEYICKSCGTSACKKCCQKRLKLQDGEKEQRVCSRCYDSLKSVADNNQNGRSSSTADIAKDVSSQQIARRSILQVKPSDSCIFGGYLELRAGNRKSWEKRYFALHQDFVLYSFKTENDTCAKTSLPVTGCKVSVDPKDSGTSSKDGKVFKLEHKHRTYFLKTRSDEDMAKWVAALQLASQAQFPASAS